MNLDQGTVEQIVGILKQNKKVNEVILFGSRAKGTAKKGSDIDIALVGEKIEFRVLCQLGVKLEDLDLPYKIDLVAYDSHTSPELKSHIERVGVSIHR